ncbi:MAG: hypothetical protein MUF35_08845 [Candidatus Nanopelagicales bacterium]|nr:hypothetical protein [Candidatus Nanopelagicales bacterium]
MAGGAVGMRRAPWGGAVARAGAVLACVAVLAGCGAVTDAIDTLEAPDDVELLEEVSLTPEDAAGTAVFQEYEGGNEVVGRTSLDLCFGDFPSEELRTGRRQVGIGDVAGATWVSSEAILYASPEQAAQGMRELQAARADCPTEAVAPQDGDGDAVVWGFLDDPDGDWPDEPGIQRQAYAFTTTDTEGAETTSTATYLRRGRMILALYVTPPDGAAVAIRNAPDPARFTEVMTNRLAGLDEAALQESNGPGTRTDPDDVEA